MLETLVIKNFGPIIDASFDLKKTTVFTGEQASGKSTVVKLIALFRSYVFITRKERNVNLKEYGIESYFNNDSFLEYKNDLYEITITNNHIEINLLAKLREGIDSIATDGGDFLLREPPSQGFYGSDKQLNQRYIETFQQRDVLLHFTEKITLYIPTERLLLSSISGSIFGFLSHDIALPKSLIRFGQNYELAKRNLQNSEIPIINVKFHQHDNTDFITDEKGNKIKLAESASGYQSIVPLILSIEEFKSDDNKSSGKKTLIVEEPELNLFPSTQKKLCYYLAGKSEQHNLIITTHSPYILSSINNLLLANRLRKTSTKTKEGVNQIIPQQYNLEHDDFECYFLSNGSGKSIYNKELGLIGENDLDKISEEIGDEYSSLLDLM